MATKAEGRFRMAINGHELKAVKRRGRWHFTCPSWPELARDHTGAEGAVSLESAVAVFTRRALAGCVSVERFTASH